MHSTPVRFSIGLGYATSSRVQKDYKNYNSKQERVRWVTRHCKNGFAEYRGIARTGSRRPVRTPLNPITVYSTDQNIKGETHFTSQQKLALNTRAI